MCQTWRSRGARYCGDCGADLTATIRRDYPLLHLAILVSVLIVVFIIITNTIFCIANFDRIIDDCSEYRFGISITYGFGDILLGTFEGNKIAIVLGLVLAVDVIFLAYAAYRFLIAFGKEQEYNDPELSEKSGLGAASSLLCASLLLGVILLLFSAMSGNGADSSWMSDYSDYMMTFMLTRAGLREELMCRVFWIGLPMMVLALVIRKDLRSWQYLMGGFGMSRTAFVLIVFSSVLFGLAHLDGWGWGKVPDAIVGGLIFGYLYTEYGLYAAVLAHTANDTMSSVGYIFGTGLESMMTLLMLAIGLAVLIQWVLRPNRSVLSIGSMKTFPDKLEYGLLEQWGRH